MAEKYTKTEGEILEEEINAPDRVAPAMYRWTNIPHYYGDYVRELLIIAAVLVLITAPFYVDNLHAQLPFIVLGTVVIVCAAALTNPRKRGIISVDTITAGIGFVVFEVWALEKYQDDPVYQSIFREVIALIFLFALYFSTKTLRNMFLNTIGRPDMPDDFLKNKSEPRHTTEKQMLFKQEARKALDDLNDVEKLDFTD